MGDGGGKESDSARKPWQRPRPIRCGAHEDIGRGSPRGADQKIGHRHEIAKPTSTLLGGTNGAEQH